MLVILVMLLLKHMDIIWYRIN